MRPIGQSFIERPCEFSWYLLNRLSLVVDEEVEEKIGVAVFGPFYSAL